MPSRASIVGRHRGGRRLGLGAVLITASTVVAVVITAYEVNGRLQATSAVLPTAMPRFSVGAPAPLSKSPSGDAMTAVPPPDAVQAPVFLRHVATGQTGWFASPALVDVTGDKQLEIIQPSYSTFLFAADGRRLSTTTSAYGRASQLATTGNDGAEN